LSALKETLQQHLPPTLAGAGFNDAIWYYSAPWAGAMRQPWTIPMQIGIS